MKQFQHYKGGFYTHLFNIIDTKQQEELMIYENQEDKIFARPKNMFFEDVLFNGEKVSRFKELNKNIEQMEWYLETKKAKKLMVIHTETEEVLLLECVNGHYEIMNRINTQKNSHKNETEQMVLDI